jgi:hypothetical protein
MSPLDRYRTWGVFDRLFWRGQMEGLEMAEAVAHRYSQFKWEVLPARLAAWLKPELPSIANEMISAIRLTIPEYRRPMEGEFALGLRMGVERALQQFTELIADPGAPQEHNRKTFRKLGRGELYEGRSLDALQAAYRVGARVAWRRYARVAKNAGLSSELTGLLGEAVFTHIHELADESAKGYAEAQANAASTVAHRRQRLLRSLLANRRADQEELADLAIAANWPLPAKVVCVAVSADEDNVPIDLPVLPSNVLVSALDAEPFLVLPADHLARHEAALRDALRGKFTVFGPAVPAVAARQSLIWARRTARLARRGALPRKPVLSATDHLGTLQLLNDEDLARFANEHTLSIFDTLTPAQRRRMEATLLAWLSSKGRTAPEVAAILGIHPQTSRYRLRQLTALLGDRLLDPDFRFEAETALRSRSLLDSLGQP